MSVVISPSILNCDFGRLADELAKISNADFAHVDIMDNHFVPNLALGQRQAEAAVKSVTFHAEAAQAPIRLAREIRAMGRRAGLALRPATGIEPYLDILGEFDMILVMTVEPGFGGQSFIEAMMPKVSRTRRAIEAAGLDVWIQVDGGVSRSTIEKAAEAGANNFVAGSAVYKADDAAAEVDFLRSLAAKHVC